MGDANGAFEWELSKENVLPLKTGRDCSKLNAALQPHTTDQQTRLKAERHEFELELRTYTGDDPLDVWDRYIRWIEKTFPSRGVGGNFADIVQGCLKQFHDDPRYKNDRRFIGWWIEFANLCDEPLEIFNFMFDKGLGCELCCFYEAWASSLEEAGNYRKAESIYQEGYKRVCEPPDGLLVKFQEFQIRVARGNLGQQEEKMEETEGRSVLGDLKPIGKKHQVGTNRTGLYKQASKGGLSCRPGPLQTQNKRLEVYNEENEQPSVLPPQGQWKVLPSRKQSNIENTLQPGPWNKAKLSQKNSSSGGVSGQPNFTIHVEDDSAFVTPRKGVIDEHVLSARKHKETDPLAAMRINSDSCPVNQVPAYMKSKIYQGSEEFCFEELRAARYLKKKREQEKILEEQRRIEAEKRQLAQMREELGNYHQAIREELKQEREKLMHDLQSKLQITNGSDSVMDHSHNVSQAAGIDNSSIVTNPPQFTIHTDSISQPPPPPLGLRENKPALRLRPSSSDGQLSSGSGSVENTREQPVTKQLNFDDITTGLTENVSQAVQQSITDTRNSKTNPNVSHNSSQQTPNLSMSSSVAHSGGSRPQTTPDSEGSFYKKRGLTAPSPTVHTQEAFQVVMGMFNCSLHTSDNQFGWTEQEQMEGIEDAPKEEAPFKIFDENSESKPPKPAAPAFPIYVDKENTQYEVPLESKSKRKGLSEVGEIKLPLQSKDLPRPTLYENNPANNFVIYEEKIEDMDADFTMATAGFNSTARLASTPYNLTANVNKLFAPPLSTIKPTERVDVSMESIHPAEVNNESTKSTFQQQEKTLDVHMNTPKKNLSPIMEGSQEGGSSDESKSQASSLASRNYSQRLPSVDESHTFPNGRSVIKSSGLRLPSVEEIQPEFQAPASHKLKFSMCESTANLPDPSVNSEQPKNDNSVTNTSNAGHVFNSTEDSLPLPPEVMPIYQHVIDTSFFVPQELDEKTEAILLTAVNIDPFSNETINDILSKLSVPLKEDPSFVDCSYLPVPEMKANNFVDMGGDTYHIKRCIGEGGYARIFVGIPALQDTFCEDDTVDIPDVVLKVQKPSCPWEFYICRQIEQRLKALQEPFDITPSIVTIKKGYFFDNGSCLSQDYFSEGTLLDLINVIKRQHKLMSELEPFAAYVTIEILHIMEKLHKCQIIHGDIKPDNFLIDKIPDINASSNRREVFGNKTRFLKLTDFGQSIDMTKFPKKTVFLSKVNTDGFKCIEMQTDQPWTYQTDLFGLVGTIHVLIFGKYMNVYQSKGKWLIASSFVRKWNQPLWKELFHTLLNVASCEDLPNLVELRTKFEDFFMSELLGRYNSLANTLRKEKSMKK